MAARSDENGYTMIETIMYISLLIILGASLAGYAHTVIERYKIGRASQQVIDLKKAIVHFTASDEDYSNLSEEGMDRQLSTPVDMLAPNHTARHALGGAALFGPVTNLLGNENTNNKYMFYITFNSLSDKACAEILTQGQFYGDGSELDTLIVNNTTAWRYQYSFYNTAGITTVKTMAAGIHPNLAEATDVCSDKKQNTITWIFS